MSTVAVEQSGVGDVESQISYVKESVPKKSASGV